MKIIKNSTIPSNGFKASIVFLFAFINFLLLLEICIFVDEKKTKILVYGFIYVYELEVFVRTKRSQIY